MTEDEETDINEIFDNIALTEEKLSQKGYEEGYQEGTNQGNLEGYQLGYAKGLELGEELGNYYGIALLNLNLTKSEKIHKSLQQLIKQIDDFPKFNDPERDLVDDIQKIRTQYKKVKAMLKLKNSPVETNQENNLDGSLNEQRKDLTF